ncbi:MAG TPA: GNAT family N-acetyltransferase [Limnochordia bacterium]|nr:GNAT family N-acetyltransferase [Limnochordia bacterium]
MSIRAFKSADVCALIDCWNAALPADPISERVLVRKVLADPNLEPEGLLVAEAKGRIAGFAVSYVRRVPLGDQWEPEWAWLTAFGVHPAARGAGLGSALLAAVDAFARSRNRRFIGFAPYAPGYFVPGIDRARYPAGAALLQSAGYARLYECVAMDASLTHYQLPEVVTALVAERVGQGYRFGTLAAGDVLETARFAAAEFGPDWGRAVRDAVSRGVPLDHFRLARDPHGEVVGFAMYGGYDHSPSRFGPFGVAERERGKGLGKILLHQTMQDMAAAGLHDCWFLWTGEKSPAGQLYLRSGFRVTRRFEVLRKSLAAPRP